MSKAPKKGNGKRGPDKRPRKPRATPPAPGPGRPRGAKNALPAGAVSAIKSLRLRVPDDAHPEAAKVADEAFETVVSIMRGKEKNVGQALARLSAARVVRDEVCGPIAKKVDVSGSLTVNLGDRLQAARKREQERRAAREARRQERPT